ncbi:MAG: GNAT family N-acetyltransferase [Thermodesulfobacteriota bacterium]|nr:GNAT family N-acetyltransferase [Thermodesulfobacteriota bacterium]
MMLNKGKTQEIIKKVAKRCLCFIFENNSALWHVRHLNDNHIEIKATIQVTVNFTDFSETLEWIKLQNIPWMFNEKEKQVAINGGHFWPNVKHEEAIIGYLKVGFGNVYISDYRRIVHFPDHVAYIYDTFILPEIRGKKIASHLINETCCFLEKQDFSRVLCHIPKWNKASLKAYSRAGFMKKKTICWIKMFGFQILTSNPANI